MVQETDGGAPVDCGLALVGPNTSLNEVRTQVREANEDDEDDEEAEVTELSKLLAAGSFTFLLPDTKAPVRRKQEKLVKGKAAGDPVLLTTTKAKKANASEGEDAAAAAVYANMEVLRRCWATILARRLSLSIDVSRTAVGTTTLGLGWSELPATIAPTEYVVGSTGTGPVPAPVPLLL